MKAIKKPIPVEFVKLEKTPQSIIEVYRFINGPDSVKLTCNAANDAWDNYSDDLINKGYMPLKTLESGEGTQNANFGDYILKGIDGECWPVNPDIFERTYDVQAPLSNETKVVESIEQKHMTIVDQVRTQVEDHTDHVSDFFIKVAGNFEGKNPHVEVQDFTNSETRLSCLKLHDKTEAFVIEKRTELNHCEYTFIQKIDASQSKNTDAVKVITDRITQLERSNPYETGNKFVAIQELNHILKLIQP